MMLGSKEFCKNYLISYYSTLKILHNRILRDISCLGADINVTVILFLMLIPDLSIMSQALSIGKELFEIQCSDFTSEEKTSGSDP